LSTSMLRNNGIRKAVVRRLAGVEADAGLSPPAH
jgi:hypothetical protein